MDPESARMVRDGIQQLRSFDRTILLCTHNLLEAEELADQIAIIQHGKIIMNDSPQNLKRRLLGPVEYEAKLALSLDGWKMDFPKGVTLTGCGDQWLRFQVSEPEKINPNLIKRLIDDRLKVISFQEIPRTLESAYLEAVKSVNVDNGNV
jgi:ABC-2 type transport system ATP-binding protein